MGIKFLITVAAAAGLALLIAESSAGPVEDAEARQTAALAIQQDATIAFNNKRREITQKNTPATNQDLAALAALQNAMDAAVQNVQAANKGVMDAQQAVWQQRQPTPGSGSTPATTSTTSSQPLTTTTSPSPGGSASPARVTTAPSGGQPQSGLSNADIVDILPGGHDLFNPLARGEPRTPGVFDGALGNTPAPSDHSYFRNLPPGVGNQPAATTTTTPDDLNYVAPGLRNQTATQTPATTANTTTPGGGQPQSGLSNADIVDIHNHVLHDLVLPDSRGLTRTPGVFDNQPPRQTQPPAPANVPSPDDVVLNYVAPGLPPAGSPAPGTTSTAAAPPDVLHYDGPGVRNQPPSQTQSPARTIRNPPRRTVVRQQPQQPRPTRKPSQMPWIEPPGLNVMRGMR